MNQKLKHYTGLEGSNIKMKGNLEELKETAAAQEQQGKDTTTEYSQVCYFFWHVFLDTNRWKNFL